MRRFATALAAVVMMAATGLFLALPAQAAAYVCNTGSSYDNAFFGTINSDVVVPSGATCNLQGATVNGSVTVQPGGSLIVGGGTVIRGGLTSTGAGTATGSPLGSPQSFSIIVCNSQIVGPVNIRGSESEVTLGGQSSGGQCGGNNFGGDVTLIGNHGPVELANNKPSPDCRAPGGCVIRGNVTVNNNTGPVTVADNRIIGRLSCSGNDAISSPRNDAAATSGQCQPNL